MATIAPPTPDVADRWMKNVGQYIGSLAVTYIQLDTKRNPAGDPMTCSRSGFFIVLDDKWYFVTAGHVFKNDDGTGLEQLIGGDQIRVESAAILDYFGKGAKVQGSTIID